jgi:hypothetical protein
MQQQKKSQHQRQTWHGGPSYFQVKRLKKLSISKAAQ